MREARRTRVVLVVLLTAALALIALSYTDSSSPVLRDVRSLGSSVFGGAEHATKSVTSAFSSSGGSSSQVASLQQQILQLRADLSEARLSQADYAELRKMLLVAGAGRYRVLAASVIAAGLGYQQTVTLDVGSKDGVRPQETVLNGEGLVGYVTAVSATTSTVLLASDGSAVVGVAVAPSGQLGWVTGPGKVAGGGLMHLQTLSSAAVLKPGDQLVTAASVNDKPYVPGVPVGVVTKLIVSNGALTAAALVRPYVDFGALGVVGVVIVPPGHDPRFAALPPLPHPGPTVTVTVTAKPGTHRPGATPSPTPSP